MTWFFPVKESFRITTGFNEPRPLSAPPEARDHPHGAWDIGCKIGTRIHAPEAGFLYFWTAWRFDPDFTWNVPWPDGSQFALRNYFYDMYGSIILLMGESGLTHVFAHSFFNQIFNKGQFGKSAFDYSEEPLKKRFPAFAFHTLENPHFVLTGDPIGVSGDAGLSSGPHIHYEIHRGRTWTSWADRTRPEELFPEIWKEWKDKI